MREARSVPVPSGAVRAEVLEALFEVGDGALCTEQERLAPLLKFGFAHLHAVEQ
jgi:hypothetical protein